MAARITSPKMKVDHPDRWLECEKAIKKRLGEIDEVDLREEAVKELIKDAMGAGWTEMELRKANLELEDATGYQRHDAALGECQAAA